MAATFSAAGRVRFASEMWALLAGKCTTARPQVAGGVSVPNHLKFRQNALFTVGTFEFRESSIVSMVSSTLSYMDVQVQTTFLFGRF